MGIDPEQTSKSECVEGCWFNISSFVMANQIQVCPGVHAFDIT